MDMDDIGELMVKVLLSIVVILMIGLVISAVLSIIDSAWYNPYRAEDAQTQCEMRGFDVYRNYKGFLRTKAYGVKCDYVDYSRKQINVGTGQQDNQERLIVVT